MHLWPGVMSRFALGCSKLVRSAASDTSIQTRWYMPEQAAMIMLIVTLHWA